MSFIQVCPQYTKNIDYYATKGKSWKLEKNEQVCVPFYHLKDGHEYEAGLKDPTFTRIGDYRVKITLSSTDGDVTVAWANSSVRIIASNWSGSHKDCRQSDQKITVLEPNIEAAILLTAQQRMTIYNVIAIIEALDR